MISMAKKVSSSKKKKIENKKKNRTEREELYKEIASKISEDTFGNLRSLNIFKNDVKVTAQSAVKEKLKDEEVLNIIDKITTDMCLTKSAAIFLIHLVIQQKSTVLRFKYTDIVKKFKASQHTVSKAVLSMRTDENLKVSVSKKEGISVNLKNFSLHKVH